MEIKVASVLALTKGSTHVFMMATTKLNKDVILSLLKTRLFHSVARRWASAVMPDFARLSRRAVLSVLLRGAVVSTQLLFALWVARPFLAAGMFDPVQRGPVLGQETGELGQATGEGVEGQDTYCPLSEAVVSRVRRRAVWVRRVEGWLGVSGGVVGKLLRGRWVPDLPTRQWHHHAALLANQLDSGLNVVGGGVVHCLDDKPDQAYLVVVHPDGVRSVVYTELLFKLASYVYLRERNALLVESVKLRALDWCKKVGLTQADTYVALQGAMQVAWPVSRGERALSASLRVTGSARFWWL